MGTVGDSLQKWARVSAPSFASSIRHGARLSRLAVPSEANHEHAGDLARLISADLAGVNSVSKLN